MTHMLARSAQNLMTYCNISNEILAMYTLLCIKCNADQIKLRMYIGVDFSQCFLKCFWQRLWLSLTPRLKTE